MCRQANGRICAIVHQLLDASEVQSAVRLDFGSPKLTHAICKLLQTSALNKRPLKHCARIYMTINLFTASYNDVDGRDL